mmetsp:Transcript_110996/g.353664  ORF Transcript_110996/g.353664 Transcript_110996/m.353664 type:complete len:209 (+) Transcript_110996:490-1116(+)
MPPDNPLPNAYTAAATISVPALRERGSNKYEKASNKSDGIAALFRPYLSIMRPVTKRFMNASIPRNQATRKPICSLLKPSECACSGSAMTHVCRTPFTSAQYPPAPRIVCQCCLATVLRPMEGAEEEPPRPLRRPPPRPPAATPRSASTASRERLASSAFEPSCAKIASIAVQVKAAWTKKMLRVATRSATTPLRMAANMTATFMSPA